MAALADAPRANWWVDRSGRTAAVAVLAVAVTAWVTTLISPQTRMPGMGTGISGMALAVPSDSPYMGAASSAGWRWPDLIAFTSAWALMMAAMMLPSATPMIALYSTVARRRGGRAVAARTTLFVAPYTALWALSGVGVYALTVWVDSLVRSHRSAHDAVPYAAAAVLTAAGLYQFTSLKRMCLANCQNPLNFLVSHWRPGFCGAARIGLAHAAYCFGCCALLMVVLVAVGAMGLAWVLLIAGAVALEKLASRQARSTVIVGIALMVLGAAVALHPSLATNLHS
jgi:predicted metal-binding membrane protein